MTEPTETGLSRRSFAAAALATGAGASTGASAQQAGPPQPMPPGPARRTGSVHAEGAELVFDTQGAGDPLLLIPGAGGDAGVYGPLAAMLSSKHLVITYDRRCNARSSGDTGADLDMAQQARDAVAVLRAAGHEKAVVFGNSGGANIALQVASDHPGNVVLLVAHEPPALGLLSQDADLMDFVQKVYRTSQTDGPPAAMKMFASRLVGFDHAGARPAGSGGLGQAKDISFFLSKEYLNITLFKPDLDTIKAAHVAAVVLAGERSGDAYYVRSARAVASGLGCPFIMVPGNHLAFLIEPAPFAQALGDVLASAKSS